MRKFIALNKTRVCVLVGEEEDHHKIGQGRIMFC